MKGTIILTKCLRNISKVIILFSITLSCIFKCFYILFYKPLNKVYALILFLWILTWYIKKRYQIYVYVKYVSKYQMCCSGHNFKVELKNYETWINGNISQMFSKWISGYSSLSIIGFMSWYVTKYFNIWHMIFSGKS